MREKVQESVRTPCGHFIVASDKRLRRVFRCLPKRGKPNFASQWSGVHLFKSLVIPAPR